MVQPLVKSLDWKADPKKKTQHLNPPWVDIEADKNPALLHLFEIWIKKSWSMYWLNW